MPIKFKNISNSISGLSTLKFGNSSNNGNVSKIKIKTADPLPVGPSYLITATGGTITYDGDYAVHTFTSSGNFTVTSKSSTGYLFDVLCVAGGCDGNIGQNWDDPEYGGQGGNGGNGGFVTYYTGNSVDTFLPVNTSRSVVVSGRGSFSTAPSYLINNSTFFSNDYANGATIKYGGGGGYGGENGMFGQYPGDPGEVGSEGTSCSITGTSIVYGSSGGGGGGSGTVVGDGAVGGSGASGAGSGGVGLEGCASANPTTSGSNATIPNRGHGGGGGGGTHACGTGNNSNGGAGGLGSDGVVIIRYKYI